MRTYKAYCMAPFFPSWLGNGTSRRIFPVTLFTGVCIVGFPGTPCGEYPGLPALLGTAGVAGFEDVDEMAAIDRYGIRDGVGLTENTLVVSSVAIEVTTIAGAYLAAPAQLLIF
jgi:hypothetical protein